MPRRTNVYAMMMKMRKENQEQRLSCILGNIFAPICAIKKKMQEYQNIMEYCFSPVKMKDS